MTAISPLPQHLLGHRIRLDPLTEQDLPALHAAIGRPEIFADGYGGGAANYHADLPSFIEWARGYYPWRVGLPFVVRVLDGPDDGHVIGTSSLTDFELHKERLHLGWTAYHPHVWGTSVNAETKLLLLSLAFDHGFGRVRIQADARNEHSRRAILKLGATFEGISRRDQPRADGSWRDAAIFSIVAADWPRVREGLQARVDAAPAEPITLSGPAA
ncbi:MULTISPECIES: GNAT family N-acetyltransferase [unclassified Pseudoclavibacter]|uniref:GNAT family N-acetyltransferase n=1 Tax=unclassified Pseudoclavibacter TaxID=2615177 RepID=UPI00130152B0|nr:MULTISPECIES: GNAT family protein [unclassified Pseudoclavibacter]KAB1644403.1 GNAT family N-acetyltransferase [Pseudoclavibacter sp. CFCC 14310]KAB1664094.1 GNAT family N-acetyltransferase [Pseudoclavibacter sp. CFCC 13611]